MGLKLSPSTPTVSSKVRRGEPTSSSPLVSPTIKPFSSPIPSSEQAPSNESKFIRSIYDSAARAIFRQFEKTIRESDYSFLRIPYRLFTEGIRKISEGSLGKWIDSKTIAKKDIVTWLTRAAENATGSAIIEPQMFKFPMAVAAGFLNMGARFGARIGFYAGNVIEKADLGIGHLANEFFSRTVYRTARLFYSGTDDLAIGLGGRFLEQFLIDSDLNFFNIGNKALNKLGLDVKKYAVEKGYASEMTSDAVMG